MVVKILGLLIGPVILPFYSFTLLLFRIKES